jgi:iron(III) transport system ATP-binding protein
MRFEIKELQKNTGVTIVYVTHDQEVALAISDRVAVMSKDGRICQIGAPDEIYEQPSDPFVFQFMGVSNFLPIEERNGQFYIKGSSTPLGQAVAIDREESVRTGRLIAGCRPFDIRFVSPGNGTQGVVRRSSYLGPIVDYAIEVGQTELRVQQGIDEALAAGGPLPEGSTVYLEFHDLKWFKLPETQALAGGVV